ncbi:hypothetical protein MBLNU457_3701t1 [Dothideomycetes sp. NU457]
MPPWGRPSGAPVGGDFEGVRRRMIWEPRGEQGPPGYDERMLMDAAKLSGKKESGARHTFVGDELNFTGYDLGDAYRARQGEEEGQLEYEYPVDDYDYDYERRRYEDYVAAMREREDALVQSAQDKIRRARAAGKSRANLVHDEIEALERRRMQQREEPPIENRPSSKSKAIKATSSANASEKGRRRSGSRMFGLSATNSPKSRASKSPKTSRKPSPEPSSQSAAPGFMVPGPDGRPILAPVGYFAHPLDPVRAGNSRPDGARHSPMSHRFAATPPYDVPYPPYPARYYPMPEESRPPLSSRRSPDELFLPRARAASTAQYPFNPYISRAQPSSPSRRNVSGPADVSYSRIPRKAPASPLDEHPSRSHHVVREDSSSGEDEVVGVPSSSESEDDDENEGVKVDVVPAATGAGYRIDRASGAEKRRRRK